MTGEVLLKGLSLALAAVDRPAIVDMPLARLSILCHSVDERALRCYSMDVVVSGRRGTLVVDRRREG